MDIHNMPAQVYQTEYWDENILDFKTAFFGDGKQIGIWRAKKWQFQT